MKQENWGISLAQLAKHFGATSTTISYAVGRGENLSQNEGFSLLSLDT
jgi:hypothetical protein